MSEDETKVVVLVADDEPSTLALVASHVRSKGYEVLEASDGDQAWQLAHEHLPDLVILDVMMPGMSGWEVCRKIREAVSLAHTGVVMLTGIGENLNEMTSPLYGADTYLDKPFEFTSLDEAIEKTLASRKEGAMGRPDTQDSDEESSARGNGLAQPSLAKATRRSEPPPPYDDDELADDEDDDDEDDVEEDEDEVSEDETTPKDDEEEETTSAADDDDADDDDADDDDADDDDADDDDGDAPKSAASDADDEEPATMPKPKLKSQAPKKSKAAKLVEAAASAVAPLLEKAARVIAPKKAAPKKAAAKKAPPKKAAPKKAAAKKAPPKKAAAKKAAPKKGAAKKAPPKKAAAKKAAPKKAPKKVAKAKPEPKKAAPKAKAKSSPKRASKDSGSARPTHPSPPGDIG